MRSAITCLVPGAWLFCMPVCCDGQYVHRREVAGKEARLAGIPHAGAGSMNLQDDDVPSLNESSGLSANARLPCYFHSFREGRVLVRVTIPGGGDARIYTATCRPGTGDPSLFSIYANPGPASCFP